MLSHFKIGARLAFAFALITGLLVAASLSGLLMLSKFKHSTDNMLNVYVALALNAQRATTLALEERRFEKDVFINIKSKDQVKVYFERWQEAGVQLEEVLNAGQALAYDEELLQHYEAARQALAEYQQGFGNVHQRIVAGQLRSTNAANADFAQYKESVYQIESTANAIKEKTSADMANVTLTLRQNYESAIFWIKVVALAAVVLAAALSVVISRSITRPLNAAVGIARDISQGDLRQKITISGRDEPAMLLSAMREMSSSLTQLVANLKMTSDSVSTGANEMSAGAEELSTRTEQQAAALQETAASMEEFSATAQQNAQATKNANELASTASERARTGGEEVKTSVSLMQEIAQRSNEMNSIIEAIDGIAFQTNILALNASVEAARAGEQGRGFAVVAAEVRSLASSAAESSGKIREMLLETQEMISRCATQANRSGETIDQTVSAIQNLAALMDEVSSATGEQISGISQVTTAVSQIDVATQQNASLVQESSATAQTMAAQAQQLLTLISRFKIIENEGSDGKPTAAQALPDVQHPQPAEESPILS